jgi:biotin carboxyl carrier protein
MRASEKSKSLNIKDTSPENTVANAEPEVLQTLLIEDVKYKTRLTKKFLNRKPYEPVNPKKVFSFIPGTIKKIYTSKGKKVKPGDKLIDLEAMKMINTIFASNDNTVAEVYIKEGELVSKNKLLLLYK